MEKDIIVKAWENKGNGQILATLPRTEFKAGDNLQVKKINLDDEELKLALWIDEQKEAYKQNQLTELQIAKLEDLPNWSWD